MTKNSFRKQLAWILVGVLILSLGGIATAPAAETGKIAAMLPGPADDDSWNEAAVNALNALDAKGHETAYAENVQPPDAPRVLREFAEEGYQMVVAHSFGYKDAVMEVASEYPDTNFAWAGGINVTAPNVGDYDQPFYEAAYLVGIIAGHVSDSGKLGAVYGFDIPVCHSMGEAALAGAKTVNPDAELLAAAAGDWADVAKAKEAALAQADAGVDYWIGCGEGPTFGTIEAAREVDGYATGYVGDMSDYAPNVVLVNLVWVLEPLFETMLEETLDGTFQAPFYRFGLKEGALAVQVNPKLADAIPSEALEQVEKAQSKIKKGALTVPYVPE